MLAVSQAKPCRAAALLQLVAPMSAAVPSWRSWRSSRTNHAYRISHGSALACKSFASVRIKIPQQACAGLAHGSMPSLVSVTPMDWLSCCLGLSICNSHTHTHTHRCGCGCVHHCANSFIMNSWLGYVRSFSLADAS